MPKNIDASRQWILAIALLSVVYFAAVVVICSVQFVPKISRCFCTIRLVKCHFTSRLLWSLLGLWLLLCSQSFICSVSLTICHFTSRLLRSLLLSLHLDHHVDLCSYVAPAAFRWVRLIEVILTRESQNCLPRWRPHSFLWKVLSGAVRQARARNGQRHLSTSVSSGLN